MVFYALVHVNMYLGFFVRQQLLYLNQEQPGLGRTKRLAFQHRQLPPKQGHSQRRQITAVGKPPSPII